MSRAIPSKDIHNFFFQTINENEHENTLFKTIVFKQMLFTRYNKRLFGFSIRNDRKQIFGHSIHFSRFLLQSVHFIICKYCSQFFRRYNENTFRVDDNGTRRGLYHSDIDCIAQIDLQKLKNK